MQGKCLTFSFSHVIIAKETKECERKRKKGMNHMLFEDSNTEFKEVYVNDVKKEVVAFANTEGGTIYIGISDDGKIVGLDQPDAVMIQAAN